MNGSEYIPVQIFTGEHGPAFKFYTLAAFWVGMRRDSPAWRVEQFGPPPAPAACPLPLFSPALSIS